MATKVSKQDLEAEAQSLQAYANEYTQQFDLMNQQLRFIETARAEALASIDALEAFKTTEGEITSLLTLGGGVSVRAKITDKDKVLVGLGAGITVEKSADEAVAFLKDRITEMEASAKRLTESISKLGEQMKAVEQRMQEISKLYSTTQ